MKHGKNCRCHTKHGHSGGYDRKPSPTYVIWKGIFQRCLNPNNARWKNYGGRGITVCERWLDKEHGFENFLADMGPRPEGKSIDRINNDGNYEPANCRWATAKEQANNQRRQKKAA